MEESYLLQTLQSQTASNNAKARERGQDMPRECSVSC